MSPDMAEDYEIERQVAEECDKRRDAETNPDADPSLYAPWGILRYSADDKKFKTNRPD